MIARQQDAPENLGMVPGPNDGTVRRAAAERRDARIGRLRAVPVVPGDGPRASHLNPDAPRAVERWNGHAWELYGFAASLADAQALLYPEAKEPSAAGPVPKRLGSGAGKHRKLQAPEPDGGGRTQR